MLTSSMEDSQDNFFDCLPEEVTRIIFDTIWDCKSLVRCMSVSRAFYHYATSTSCLCIVCPDNYHTYEGKLKHIFSMVKRFQELKTLIIRVGHPKDEPAPWARCMRYAEIGSSVEKFMFMAAKTGDFQELDNALICLEYGSDLGSMVLKGTPIPDRLDETNRNNDNASSSHMGIPNKTTNVDLLAHQEDRSGECLWSKMDPALSWSEFLKRRISFEGVPTGGLLSNFSLKEVVAPTNDVMRRMLPVIHFAILHGLNEFRDSIPFFVANFPKLRRFLFVDLLESVTIHLRQHHLDEIRGLRMQDVAEWKSFEFEEHCSADEDSKWKSFVSDENCEMGHGMSKINKLKSESFDSDSIATLNYEEGFDEDKSGFTSGISRNNGNNMGREKPPLQFDSERQRKGKDMIDELPEDLMETQDINVQKIECFPKVKELSLLKKNQNFKNSLSSRTVGAEDNACSGVGLPSSRYGVLNSSEQGCSSSVPSAKKSHNDNLVGGSSTKKSTYADSVPCKLECLQKRSTVGRLPERCSELAMDFEELHFSDTINKGDAYRYRKNETIKHHSESDSFDDSNRNRDSVGLEIASNVSASSSGTSESHKSTDEPIHFKDQTYEEGTTNFQVEPSSVMRACDTSTIPDGFSVNPCCTQEQPYTSYVARNHKTMESSCEQNIAQNFEGNVLFGKDMISNDISENRMVDVLSTSDEHKVKQYQDFNKNPASISTNTNTGPFLSSRDSAAGDRFAERDTWRTRLRQSRDLRQNAWILEAGRMDWEAQRVARTSHRRRRNDLEKEAILFDYSFWRTDHVVTENYHLSDVSMCVATFSAKPLGEADIKILSCAGLAGPLLAATVSYVNKHHKSHNL